MRREIGVRGRMAVMALVLGLSALSAGAAPWKFLVYGDSRGTGSTTDEVAQINMTILPELVVATTNENPAFVLFPGDLVNKGNVSTLALWTNVMAPVYEAGIGVYPVFGNHDDDGGDPSGYTNIFSSSLPANGPPSELYRTYAVRNQNVLVLAMDSYLNGGVINTGWVDSVLSTNNLPHVFAFSHKPGFDTDADVHEGLDNYGNDVAERDAFWRSLERAGSRAYFAGHIHVYDHARLDDGDGNPDNDVHQYVVGTGGASLTANDGYVTYSSTWTPQRVLREMQYGYAVVEIDRLDVTITWKHRTAPGVYEATSDVFAYHVLPRQDTLEVALGEATSSNVTLRATGLTASATNTIEMSTDLTSTNWSPVHQFESWASTFEWTVDFMTNRAFYRLRSE